MASPNPYASPENPRESDRDERFVRRYLPIMTVGLLIGCGITFFHSGFGVPFTLFAMPALLRGTRVYWRKRQATQAVSLADWGLLIFVSLFAAIPISLVGIFAFCCVCTPVGFLLADVVFGYHLQPNVWFQIPIFAGLAAGVFAALFLLQRLHYLSKDEKEALQQAEMAEAPPEEPADES